MLKKICAGILVLILQLALIAHAAPPTVGAQSVVLIDAQTGLILFQKDGNAKMYPASLTKIVTAMLALEKNSLREEVTVTQTALDSVTADSSKLGLVVDETMPLEDMLYALMLPSANDAANAIAEHVSGSIDAFVDDMNAYARELGCTNTNFVNPSGLHSDDHYTTATDMALITREALSNATFAAIAAKNSYTIAPTNKSDAARDILTTNTLLNKNVSLGYTYATGVKTGHTSAASYCLSASATKDGRDLIAVILGAKSENNQIGSFLDAKRLFTYGFDKCVPQLAHKKGDIIKKLPIDLAKGEKEILLEAEMDVTLTLPEGTHPILGVNREIILDKEETVAPVKAGDVKGVLKISKGGIVLASVPLVADKDYEYDLIGKIIESIVAFLTSPPFVTGVIIFLILAIISLLIIRERIARRRRRERQRRLREHRAQKSGRNLI